jgi:hypothetical protein
LLPLPRISG